MKSPSTKSSEKLKREVDQQIRKVEGDFAAMKGRLTPGQLIDDAIFFRQGQSLGATFEHLKRNPVGTTFLALGTILLIEDENHQTIEKAARNKVTSLKDSVISVKQAIKDQLPHHDLEPDMNPNTGDIAKAKLSSLKESVREKVADLKDHLPLTGASEAGEQLKNKVSGLWSEGKERVQNLDTGSMLALGVGLGALTAAAFPVSDTERKLVQDKLGDRMSTLQADLESAINECSDILKDLIINDFKDYSIRPFR